MTGRIVPRPTVRGTIASPATFMSQPSLPPRSLSRAIALGLLIGLVFAVVLAAAVFFGTDIYIDAFRLGGSWSSLGLALVTVFGIAIGAPLLILAGGILGAYRLRTRRSRRFTYLWFPLSLLPIVALAGAAGIGVWVGGGRRLWEHLQQARHLQWAIANRSQDDIFDISFYMDPASRPLGYAWEHFTPAMPVELHTSESVMPGWPSERTVTVAWQRIVPCSPAVTAHCGGDGELLQAQVPVPRYGWRWNKAYVLVFLPHDRVGIDIVDRGHFDGRVSGALPAALVVKAMPKPQEP